VLGDGGRAIDVCGGSGHLTRAMAVDPGQPPVLADLYFSKLWLARRFTAPGCEAVACDGNSPMPFARGAFRLAVCSDAFMYIWTKRQFVQEMLRLTDVGDARSAAIIGHTHNELVWSPSHGQPLPPSGYRELFETIEPRLFAEAPLLRDMVGTRSVDLSRHDSAETIDGDPALALVASRWQPLFARHTVVPGRMARGEYRLNPLYDMIPEEDGVRLRLRFPSDDYEQEYGACRLYLPDELTVDAATMAALPARSVSGPLEDLVRRRVVLDLPVRWS
jgi:hypothetical protein